MKIITKKHIDLSNYEQKDLKINTNAGSSLIIQCAGINGSLSAKGKNADAELNVILYAISNSFATVNDITEDGMYTFDVSGVDNIELEYAGDTGDIYVRVVD